MNYFLIIQGHLLIKDSFRKTFITTETVPMGTILIFNFRGQRGWFLMGKPNVQVFCTSDDTARLTPALLRLLLPLSPPARIELFVNNLNALNQMTLLQIDDEVLVKLDHHNVILKAIIRYKGSLPALKGDYFGIELLVSDIIRAHNLFLYYEPLMIYTQHVKSHVQLHVLMGRTCHGLY